MSWRERSGSLRGTEPASPTLRKSSCSVRALNRLDCFTICQMRRGVSDETEAPQKRPRFGESADQLRRAALHNVTQTVAARSDTSEAEFFLLFPPLVIALLRSLLRSFTNRVLCFAFAENSCSSDFLSHIFLFHFPVSPIWETFLQKKNP